MDSEPDPFDKEVRAVLEEEGLPTSLFERANEHVEAHDNNVSEWLSALEEVVGNDEMQIIRELMSDGVLVAMTESAPTDLGPNGSRCRDVDRQAPGHAEGQGPEQGRTFRAGALHLIFRRSEPCSQPDLLIPSVGSQTRGRVSVTGPVRRVAEACPSE